MAESVLDLNDEEPNMLKFLLWFVCILNLLDPGWISNENPSNIFLTRKWNFYNIFKKTRTWVMTLCDPDFVLKKFKVFALVWIIFMR